MANVKTLNESNATTEQPACVIRHCLFLCCTADMRLLSYGGGESWKEWEIEGDGNIDLLPSFLSLLAPL